MKAGRCCALMLVGATTFIGCRQDPGRELLERDLRLQEDKIYHLKGHLNEMAASLEACRRENALLKRDQGTSSGELPEPQVSPPTTTTPTPPRPRSSPRPPETLPGLEAPIIEGVPEIDAETSSGAPSLQLNPPSNATGPRIVPASKTVEIRESSDVDRISLNQRLTGPYNADGEGADEGITVLIEPRDAQGKIVLASADVTVVLIDPTGGGTRVARWDFHNDEIIHKFQQNAIGQGIYLRLLWPEGQPASQQLRMHVRYTTLDGRRLEGSRDIELRSTGTLPAKLDPLTAETESRSVRVASQVEPMTSEISPSSQKPSPSKPSWSPYR